VYRKIIEKSRSFCSLFFGQKRIDTVLLFASVAAAICIAVIQVSAGTIGTARQTELLVSARCETLLGAENAAELIRAFEKQNPDLRIRIASENTGKGSSPDVLFFDEGEYGALLNDGTLSPHKFFVSAESQSSQFAIPLISYMNLLFYNIDLLDAAGFDRPPKTRNEFLVCAKAVSAAGKTASDTQKAVCGSALALNASDTIALQRDVFSWIWAAGGDFGSVEKPQFNTKTIIDTLAFLGRLYSEGALADNSFNKTGADRIEEFSNGKIALLIASTKEISEFQKKLGNSFGVTVIPGMDSPEKARTSLDSVYAGISAESGRQNEAEIFLAFLDEKKSSLAEVMPGALSNHYDGGDQLYEKVRDIGEAAEITSGFWGSPLRSEYERIVREEIQLFLEKNRPPVDTAIQIQKRWDSLKAMPSSQDPE
jgi:multiple sugar transport system substrate-binding protein